MRNGRMICDKYPHGTGRFPHDSYGCWTPDRGSIMQISCCSPRPFVNRPRQAVSPALLPPSRLAHDVGHDNDQHPFITRCAAAWSASMRPVLGGLVSCTVQDLKKIGHRCKVHLFIATMITAATSHASVALNGQFVRLLQSFS